MPMTRLLGEVTTYNLLIIGSFALTAFGTYLFALELWQNRLGAFFAALSVAACAYRYTHAEGHLSIVSTQWILFFFYYLERTLRAPTVRNGVVTGLFYSLCAWVTWYYAWSVPIATGLYLAVRIAWIRPRELATLWRPTIAATVVVLMLVGPFIVPYALATSSGAMAPRSLGEAQIFAASVYDYFIPPIGQSFAGHWAQSHWRSGANGAWLSEWEIYLGLPTLLLGIVGALRASRRKTVWALLALAGGCFLFSLGPSLYLAHPSSINPAVATAPLSRIPLPVMLLNRFPPFSLLRSWARMGFFVEVAVALLAAGGITYLLGKLRNRPSRIALGLTAIFALLVDSVQIPMGMAPVAGREVDRWLAKQPGHGIVMEFPIPENGYSGPAMYSTRLTGKRIVMGYASYPPNASYFPTLAGFPSSVGLDLLQSWGVEYVLVNADLYKMGSIFDEVEISWSSLAAAIDESHRLQPVINLNGVYVYRLEPKRLITLGNNLILDPGFESSQFAGSAGWSPVGRPRIDVNSKQAHNGKVSCVVDPDNYLLSSPVRVSPNEYYSLRCSSRRATSAPAETALEVTWLNSRSHPLPSPETALETEQVGNDWITLEEVFRAPSEANFGVIRATTKMGKAKVDDYTLQKVAPDAATLSAIPDTLEISPLSSQASAAIAWSSHSGQGSYVTLSIDNHPEEIFARGSKATQIFTGGKDTSSYEFRLYNSSMEELRALVLKTKPAELIKASPVIFSPGKDVGSTVISWKLPAGKIGEVRVAVKGAAEVLFARDNRGSQKAAWIARNTTYEFRLYLASKPQELLGKVIVRP
jgi:hypothetical protein